MHSNILYKIKPQAIQLGVHIQYLAVSYSHMGMPHTTIGHRRFTSEFGMGSGGTTALSPPGLFL